MLVAACAFAPVDAEENVLVAAVGAGAAVAVAEENGLVPGCRGSAECFP